MVLDKVDVVAFKLLVEVVSPCIVVTLSILVSIVVDNMLLPDADVNIKLPDDKG
jgi:hypothetical protein